MLLHKVPMSVFVAQSTTAPKYNLPVLLVFVALDSVRTFPDYIVF